MILLGSSDIGALQYLSRFKDITKFKKIWITQKKYYNFLRSQKLKIVKNYKSIKKPMLIITGSPLGDTLDKKLIMYGKKNNIKTIQVIEHWTNFRERFLLKKKRLYPDIIFVNDKIAYNLAIKSGLPQKKLKIMGNVDYEYYSKKLKIKNLKSKTNYILFVSEKIKGSTQKISREYKVDEFETINRILNVLPQKYKLIIKVHPSDNINKYEKFLKNKNVIIKKNMKFKEMVQKPKKIIGIKSALLLKLSIFRSDIVSFRPKKDLMFIGEKLGVVKLVRKNLSRYIENKIINKHNFNKRFIGSKQKIKFFLQSKIIE